MKNRLFIMFSFFILLFVWGSSLYAVTPEPIIEDYTNYPIFQINAVTPNIHIILDNSGSMNFNAYGTWPGDDSEVVEPYDCAQASGVINVISSNNWDDAEQRTVEQNTWYSSNDLDFGGYYSGSTYYQTVVGLRFQNIVIPDNSTIARAYIQFTGRRGSDYTGESTSLIIYGQADDNPGQFNNVDNDISDRLKTPATVAWNNIPDWAHDQTDNDTRTPDISSIIQEIIDRPGWQSGNPMAFIFERSGTTGKRDTYARDNGVDRAPVLHIELDVDEEAEECTTTYYGYFDPESRYTYNVTDELFERDPSGDWDGNWLNWCTMRRIDVLRKVLVGGRAEIRDGSGSTILRCEIPAQTSRGFSRFLDGTEFTPHDGSYWFGVKYGNLYVDDDSSPWSSPLWGYRLRVKREESNEPDDFLNGNITGVLQRIGDRAHWGNQWFYSSAGGGVENPIGTDLVTMIGDLEDKGCDTWTPLSENYYVAMRYFMQQHGSYYNSNNWYPSGNFQASRGSVFDPYYQDSVAVPCAKSFCIFLTDGAPTQDQDIPTSLKNYDEDTHEGDRTYASNGSDYLDDVALFARTNDLRDDLDDVQNLILYTIYAFGNEQNARELLQDAAKNGAFVDKDNDQKPDTLGDPRGGEWDDLGNNQEWDADGDDIPDTYYEAQDGYQLESELLAAINDILKRSASGTAVSVLATKGDGEGTLVQAFFKPTLSTNYGEIKWLGYLQSLWVDQYGYTREDTNGNYALDTDQDNIIQFYLDQGTGETKVKVFEVSGSMQYPDNNTWTPDETKTLEEIEAIWEAGDLLADRGPDDRKIFTYTGSTNGAIETNQFIEFATSNVSDLKPFFGIENDATWSYLGQSYNDRTNNLIHFIRGEPDDSANYEGDPYLRRRTLDDGRLWKLGDIVYSTPMSISKPVENYGLLYDDHSYRGFFQKYRDRETVVYVGGNDGMLHAFTSGVYRWDEQKFYSVYDIDSGYDLAAIPDTLGIGDVPLGSELWSYVPQNLLPHLKWLPYDDYTHVFYVDLKPKVVDARIFTDDTDISDNATHPGGWGTVLIGGMNMGGKEISTDNGTFSPAFFAIDVTNPRNPQLLWERNFPNLGFTTNQPCVLSVGNEWDGSSWNEGQWYLTISSGPTDYDGSSNQNGHVYIVDLLTGGEVAYREFVTPDANAYMNSPVALDKGMNYNVDGIYVAANFGTCESRIYKITIPQNGAEFDPFSTDYDENPVNWTMTKLLHSPRPITGPMSLSIDKRDNCWIFTGTGRYIEESDKTSTDQNFIFGIKDPFFNPDKDNNTCYRSYPPPDTCELDMSDLFYAGAYTVHAGGAQVDVGSGGITEVDTFTKLLEEVRKDIYDGWFRELCPGSVTADGSCQGSGPSERILNKPAVLGGLVLIPTFAPNSDICGFGGNGRLFAVFYETGTAYKNRVMGEVGQATIIDVIGLGEGLSSSFGIHVGKEEGGTIYGQMSTGVIQQVDIIPAFNPKSNPIYWKEEP